MRRALAALACALGLVAIGARVPDDPAGRPVAPGDKGVVLELFTSQGCNSCPAAEELLGELAAGDPRLVPLAFHVDYFNEPWKDRFSDPLHSGRQWQYSLLYNEANKVGKEDYLYFTPMLMVDGREPMLGSDRAKAAPAIKRALADRPGVAMVVELKAGAEEGGKVVEVTLSEPSAAVVGREVLVGMALWENPVTTAVGSGENGGKTLVEHYAVRKLEVRTATPRRDGPSRLSFPATLPPGADPARCGVAVYVQDEKTGRMHQARSVGWGPAPPATGRGR